LNRCFIVIHILTITRISLFLVKDSAKFRDSVAQLIHGCIVLFILASRDASGERIATKCQPSRSIAYPRVNHCGMVSIYQGMVRNTHAPPLIQAAHWLLRDGIRTSVVCYSGSRAFFTQVSNSSSA
jgi:hypothetical protein